MTTAPRRRGFVPTLFDATFSHLLTLRLVRVLYLLALISVGTVAFVLIFSGISQGPVVAVLSFVVIPTLALLCIGVIRLVLEAVVVVFQMGEHTARMADAVYRMSNQQRSTGLRDD